MHLRNLVTKMCIDIEHDLKVQLLNQIENDINDNAYDIVENFLSNNHYVLEKIEKASGSPFTGNLIQKYFTINQVDINGRVLSKIVQYNDCPAWVLMELLSFGDFIHFYKYYYSIKKGMPISSSIINLVKSLRNGCAHNNCIIADLNAGGSKIPVEISKVI